METTSQPFKETSDLTKKYNECRECRETSTRMAKETSSKTAKQLISNV